jgi:hypothetical protein
MLGLLPAFPMWLGIPITLLGLLIAIAIYYFTATFDYWKKKGIPYTKPYPVVGSLFSVIFQREHMVDFCLRSYHQNQSFMGFFQGRTPALFVSDPSFIKCILVKDFAYFTDRGFKVNF